MKKCFTINAMRTRDDFTSYDKIISDNIFCAVELFYPYNVTSEQATLYEEEVTKLINNHPLLEVVLHLPHGGLNNLVLPNFSRNEEIINRMRDAITFAKKHNAKKLTLHLGSAYNNESEYRQKLINALIPILQELCDYAKDQNIMIENMPRDNELGYAPLEILDIIKRVNMPNIKFILDTGHAHVSDYKIDDYIITLKDYLYHIHFSDNHGICDEHKPIGSGTIDFTHVFKLLNNIHYNELHCLEILFKDFHDLLSYAKDIEEFNYLYS